MIKKIKIASIMFVVIIFITCGCSNSSENITNEVDKINSYLKTNHGYEIRKIPEGVSVAPCPSGIRQLEFPQYVLVNEMQGDSYVGAYYYPFESAAKVNKIITQIGEEYILDFYVISNSIIYVPETNEALIEVLQKAKADFATN